ncbi:flagellar biosynthesis anti-sigma factor FlgM [Bowmanella pacifica]|uniref:Negative regulator of flagellin synthesis n=1 Tax=Bowmanella pacifica TaxID=502051 RepID=A0A917YYX1_9ALTE|nr:flagellar biosynthesis anti-sigma factor FlgM [Bowmanella pacifica]GGO69303.1 hypothetical protein GCM10010982_20120 [Bowmanella pacifica]
MKIQSQPALPVDKLQQQVKQTASEQQQPGLQRQVNNQASTSVSDTSKSASQAFSALAEHDGVDMQKVQQMRDAIANGELVLDEARLIDALLDMHRS